MAILRNETLLTGFIDSQEISTTQIKTKDGELIPIEHEHMDKKLAQELYRKKPGQLLILYGNLKMKEGRLTNIVTAFRGVKRQ